MAYTGGELNKLNGDYGISAPGKSVPVMKLIKNHQPKSKDELYQLIEWHYKNNCFCNIKSQGTVKDFGKNLYEAQIKEWQKYKHTLQECIQWEYDLFITQSLKGALIENRAKEILQNKLQNLIVIEADGFVDEELRIDLIVCKHDLEMCGIQIKPETYKFMRQGVITYNKIANTKWGKPVFYLFYNEKEEFINMDEVVGNIIKTIVAD